MQATLPRTTLPVSRSTVEPQERTHRQSQQQRQTHALKLRRQLVRRRYLFQQRLDRVLSPELRAELRIRVVLDNRYLQRPEFIGIFEDGGQQWRISFQPHPLGGRWYFRSPADSILYVCSSKYLEMQLCYALWQCRSQSHALT